MIAFCFQRIFIYEQLGHLRNETFALHINGNGGSGQPLRHMPKHKFITDTICKRFFLSFWVVWMEQEKWMNRQLEEESLFNSINIPPTRYRPRRRSPDLHGIILSSQKGYWYHRPRGVPRLRRRWSGWLMTMRRLNCTFLSRFPAIKHELESHVRQFLHGIPIDESHYHAQNK